jgi:predicted dehydrogenase
VNPTEGNDSVATPPLDVIIVGVGTVAQTHLRVLEQTPGAEVVAGVDIAGRSGVMFRSRPVPVYQAVPDARDRHRADVVVVATPTPAHAQVCAEVAASFPAARILVEKPAAGDLAGARLVLADIGRRQPVEVAYHMAFSPEVAWGVQVTEARAGELGAPVAAQACFNDPYQDEYESATVRLVSSWIDSGINSLSVLNRFADLGARTSLRRIGDARRSVYEAHLTCRADGSEFDALILTSWHVTDAARTTRIRYDSGAELIMDHHAVAGYLMQNGKLAGIFGSDRAVPRRERHYLALYRWWLTGGHPIMPAETSLHLHDLLLQPPNDEQES